MQDLLPKSAIFTNVMSTDATLCYMKLLRQNGRYIDLEIQVSCTHTEVDGICCRRRAATRSVLTERSWRLGFLFCEGTSMATCLYKD